MIRYFWGAVALYIVAFYSLWLQPWRFAPLLCDQKEATAVCVREWVGSLSGWFGAAAAFATIWFIIGQLFEQKRQTDFTLGDALPTIDVTPDLDDTQVLVVRIVNWNRRGMLLRGIAVNFDASLGLMEVKRNGEEVPLSKLRWPTPIRGWEDRNNDGPATLQLKIVAENGQGIVSTWPANATVKATVHILGDRHDIKTLSAAIQP